ncbi:MAG: hypothetical protein IJZ62_02910 [Clostridia bacterium]|nr:hypothetical protein [Clostridia bacterium]
MKKKNKILAGALAGACVLGGGFALAGCGDDFTPTKMQIAEAVSAMANKFAGEQTSASASAYSLVTYDSEDYTVVEYNTELLRVSRMGVLVSEICKNEGFELTFKAFDGYINDRGVEFNLKMKFEYEQDITKFEFLMFVLGGVQSEQNVYYEYIVAEIDYDYENQVMNGFALEDYMISMDSSEHFHFNGDALKKLNTTSNSYATAKSLLVNNLEAFKAEDFKEEEFTDTDYDISEEYATAMSLN